MAFDIAPYSGAITAVSDLVGGAMKRLFPEKMSELDAASMKQAITLELMKQDWEGVVKEFDDRASARVLAAADVAKGNWFTTVLSATVRPIFGYAVMIAFFLPLAARIAGNLFGHPIPDIAMNDIEKEISLTVIYFFFGGRTVEKGMAMWTDMKTTIPGVKK